MKKSLLKNNLREIIKTRRRFLSILVMSFLGVGFFSGIVACGPDMADALDNYADRNKLYDIDIVSTLGLEDEDISEINNVSGVEKSNGIKSIDTFASLDNEEEICKLIEYSENINVPTVISGRLPEGDDECIIDSRYSYTKGEIELIGKKIKMNYNEKNSDDEEILKIKEFSIVGIATSPAYISSERGTASIGDGAVDYFVYVKNGTINTNYYTDIFVVAGESESLETMSEEYTGLIDNVNNNIEQIKSDRELARYNSLINEANGKLDDAQAEYDDKKKEADEEFAKAERKIRNAKQDIIDAKQKLEDGENELNQKEADAKNQFEDARNKLNQATSQIADNMLELNKAEAEYNAGLPEAMAGIATLDEGISTINTNLETLNTQKETLENNIAALETVPETPEILSQKTLLNSSLTEVNSTIAGLNTQLSALVSQKTDIENTLSAAKTKIDSAKAQINSANAEVESQKANLNSKIEEANNEFAKARQELEDGKKEIENGQNKLRKSEAEYKEKKAEAEEKLDDAQNKINKARDDVSKIEKAKWYITKRPDNLGYSNVKDAIATMTNIAKYFPFIFYLIAVLICLTSMTRMIEEERTEIGTLKALGYTNTSIISKYITYVLFACIIGGTVGMFLGFYILPNIVWKLYSILYTIPNFEWKIRPEIGIEGLVLEVVCICIATIYVANKELKNVPASLMRPKPPRNGKTILLEKITFIWKRFNFSQKVVARNIFRYKKRAFITIFGIAGCTALMLSGFGIKDSVMDLPKSEFTNDDAVFTYDLYAILSDTDKISEVENLLKESNDISDFTKVYAGTCEAKGENRDYNISIFAIDNVEEFRKQSNLIDANTKELVEFSNDGIVLTDKIAELMNLNVGDKISIIDSDDLQHEFLITGIAENYVANYIFMTKEFYSENMKTFSPNMMLAKAANENTDLSNILGELLKMDSVSSVQDTDATIMSINDMLETINSVVVILVVSSALLNIVVLYNLANINIGEREREIATLKVLGFYDKEVDNYINKENIIYTFLGIALGLFLGIFLTEIIVGSVEIEKLRFLKHILPQSYFYAGIMTLIFSISVDFVIHFVLKKIDMIESLKSVE